MNFVLAGIFVVNTVKTFVSCSFRHTELIISVEYRVVQLTECFDMDSNVGKAERVGTFHLSVSGHTTCRATNLTLNSKNSPHKVYF